MSHIWLHTPDCRVYFQEGACPMIPHQCHLALSFPFNAIICMGLQSFAHCCTFL